MLWTDPRRWWRAGLAVALLVAGAFSLALFSAPPEKSLSVFAANGNFSVPIIEISGKDYADAAELLQKFGTVTLQLNGAETKLRYEKTEGQFQDGKNAAKIGRAALQLSDTFILRDNHPLFSLRTLAEIFPRFTGQKADYREASRRLFVGNAGIHFTAELKKSPEAFVLSFTAPVDPQISNESGKLRLLFTRDGLNMGTQSWKFDHPLVTSAAYNETPAGPELIITGSEPLLATFGEGGKTVTIIAAPKTASAASTAAAPAVASNQPPPPESTAAAPATTTAENPANPPNPAAPNIPHAHFLVLLDAGHGGEERGAALAAHLDEKDVTLSIARRVRAELQNRGVVTFLVRDGDATLSLDQRAVIANAARSALYISIHAGSLGRGLRIYTSMLAPTPAPAGGFLPWETAQAGFVQASRKMADTIMEHMDKSALRFPVASMPAPVRPLNNIAGPALAVEVAPETGDVNTLSSANYQQTVASTLAAAIAATRPASEQAP